MLLALRGALGLFGLSHSAHAQLGTINHDPTNAYGIFVEYDTIRHLLYGTGFQHWNQVDVNRIWQWRNGEFNSLGGGLIDSSIRGLQMHNGFLYLSGTFNEWVNEVDIQHLGRWDGDIWQVSGEPNAMTYLFKTGDELWCTGSFDTIGTAPITRPARLNGDTWEAFEGQLPATASPLCGALYQGEYYFGGNFTTPFFLTEDIIKWDGTEWVSVGGGIPDPLYGQVNTMVVYQGRLYVGGIFGAFGFPGFHSMSWDGIAWEPFFPELVTPVGGQVKHMEVIDGKLYQTGRFRFAGENERHYAVLMYDGEQLCGIGSMPPDAPVGQAFDLCGNADSIFFNTDTRVLSGDSVNFYAVWPVANGPDTCVSIPTWVRERHRGQQQLTVWPDPATDLLTIEVPLSVSAPWVELLLFDASGRALERRSIAVHEHRLQLDVSRLATGTYFGRLLATGEAFRFVKR